MKEWLENLVEEFKEILQDPDSLRVLAILVVAVPIVAYVAYIMAKTFLGIVGIYLP